MNGPGDSGTTKPPPNEWRETVRNIFDMLVLSRGSMSPLEARMLAEIKGRHHDYFCGGKTTAEWEAVTDAR